MATKKTPASKAPAKDTEETAAPKATGTNIIDWETQMAADAALAQKMEASTSTGAFFSTKAGQLSWNSSPVENNQVPCVILDTVLENISYDADYDVDNPSGPRCFAFGRDEAEMRPHPNVVAAGQQVHETCAGCPRNQYGSAETGRGKACNNIRRLALIPAGKLDGNGKFTAEKDASAITESTMGFLKLNVMSVKEYSAYVKQSTAALKRPTYGLFTKIKVVPDAKSQFRIKTEGLGLIPAALMSAVMGRVEEARASIEQPYSLERDDAPAKPAARGAARKAPAKKAAGKRKF